MLCCAWGLAGTCEGSGALEMLLWTGRISHHLRPLHHPRSDVLPAHAMALTEPTLRCGLGPPYRLDEGHAGWGLSESDPIECRLLEEEVGVVGGVQS